VVAAGGWTLIEELTSYTSYTAASVIVRLAIIFDAETPFL